MLELKDLIIIGRIQKPHGYKGEVTVLFDYDCKWLQSLAGTPLFIEMDGILVPFFVESIRGNASNKGYVKLEDIDSENEASYLGGRDVLMKKDELASRLGISIEDLEQESEDCIGFEVFDADSKKYLGKVTGIESGPEYDYLLVESEEDGKELTIPYIEEFVVSIEETDSGEGMIYVTLPEGFMEI